MKLLGVVVNWKFDIFGDYRGLGASVLLMHQYLSTPNIQRFAEGKPVHL